MRVIAHTIEDALALCRKSLISVAVFSFFLNILMLTPMFYLINVYDKAVGTGSFATLISLSLVAVFMYLFMGVLEWTRSAVLVHVGTRLDKALAPRLYQISFSSESGMLSAHVGAQPLADLNGLRQFLVAQWWRRCAIFPGSHYFCF